MSFTFAFYYPNGVAVAAIVFFLVVLVVFFAIWVWKLILSLFFSG